MDAYIIATSLLSIIIFGGSAANVKSVAHVRRYREKFYSQQAQQREREAETKQYVVIFDVEFYEEYGYNNSIRKGRKNAEY